MRNIFFIFLLSIFANFSCTKSEIIEKDTNSFSILAYDAEISETLGLNIEDIRIDPPKELNYWSQHFQNPGNNLNNIYSLSAIEDKSKIVSGTRGAMNIIQPIYFNDTLCYILPAGLLECKNLKSSEKIFSIDIKIDGNKKYEVIRGGLAYFDNKIVLVDAYGQILLIDANNGNKLWDKKIEFPILSPPLIYRDKILFISSDNRLFSLSFETGDIEWSFQTVAEDKKSLITASPIAFENIIIAPFSNGELVAFTNDSGRPIWSENVSQISLLSNFDIKDISASPVLSNNTIFSISTNGKLISINAINGKRNWAIDLSGYRTPVISGGQIYLIDEDGKLICLNKDTGEVFWISELKKFKRGQKAKDLNLWLGPYLINNLLYNISYFGELKIVSPMTGEVLSTDSLGVKGIILPPVILSNSVFVMDENSNVFQFE
ncbi:PQQ-binding-like beta-propeller repeat protein [Pelagibacteraceae bacterium]|nr:PQQ-binding-like beta-propeller repeat protein [Pelagibacteraceae bacterium]